MKIVFKTFLLLLYFFIKIPVFAQSTGTGPGAINRQPEETTSQTAPQKKSIDDEDGPDIDPNENLGPDSRWIANLKLDGTYNFPLGISVEYYFLNSPDSKNHLAAAIGLDTIQFKHYYPSAEFRYELGINHRLAFAIKYSLLYVWYMDYTSHPPSLALGGTVPGRDESENYPVHGFSFLVGYSHQGSNRLFFSFMGGITLSIDSPWGYLYGYYPASYFEVRPTFALKLGYRFI